MGSCSNFTCSGGCASTQGQSACPTCNNSGCAGWCSGGCLSSCEGECEGCGSNCSGTCRNTCEGGCKDGCGTDCIDGCKGDCGVGCNTGCSSDEALSLYQTLKAGLNKKIYHSDMNNINRMIEIEASANRFNKPITSQTFSQKVKAQSNWVKQLQANLVAINQSPQEKAEIKNHTWEATGQELIDLVLASADTKIPSDATGK